MKTSLPARRRAQTLHDGGASAEFTLPGNKTDYADVCEVRYTGTSVTSYGAYNRATAAAVYPTQTRTTANDFSKAGEWGDCGTGVARNTGHPDKFNFTLEHKPAYLCFLPRCENATLAPNIRLKGIKITATKVYFGGAGRNILADLYNFTDGETLWRGSSPFGNDYINVTLPEFPLSITENQEANATYLVVPPDKYDFKIEYTIKDPTTNLETVITDTKTNITLDKGNIYDVTANLSPAMPKYCMWDAKYDYWYNHLKADGTPDGNYPQNNSDPRWYHEGTGPFAAMESCKDLPNVNEMYWYAEKGDPHWTTQTATKVINGHLQNGYVTGLWLKKKAAILRDNTDISESRFKNAYPDTDGNDRDWRTETIKMPKHISTMVIQSTPANISDYFFLPAAGAYSVGSLYMEGTSGYYWSSSPVPGSNDTSFSFQFSSGSITVATTGRQAGFTAIPFK